MKKIYLGISLLFIAVLLTSCASVGTGSNTTTKAPSNTVVVGDFIGQNVNHVKNDAENVDKYTFVTTEEYNSEVPFGNIIKQDPAPGSEIEAGGKVTLTISKGEEMVQIPEVFPGEAMESVKTRITGALFICEFAYEYSETVENNQVIRTEPAFPEKRPSGSVVKVFLCQK